MRSIDIAHATPLRRDLPPFRAGDTVRVHVKIREGEKERIQVFDLAAGCPCAYSQF